MFKTVLIITTFLFSGFVYASGINNNNNAVEETPYQWIVRTHAENPIDFIGLAAEAAEMRARYNRTCLNILLSDDLSTEEKYDFNLKLNPSDRFKLVQYEMKLAQTRDEGYVIKYPQLKAEIAGSSLADRFTFQDNFSAADMTFAERAVEVSKSADVWDFLARSLKSLMEEGEPQDIAFIKKLLLESHQAHDIVIANVFDVQKQGRTNEVIDKRLSDETSYIRYVLESIVLHLRLVMKLDDDQIPLMPLICEGLGVKSVSDVGGNFLLCLTDEKLSILAGLSNEPFRILKASQTKKATVRARASDAAYDALWTRMEEHGHLNNSFVNLYCFQQGRLYSNILRNSEIRALAQQFTLSSKCLSFDDFYPPLLKLKKQKEREARAAELAEKQKVLEATKESRANSFVSNLPSQPVRKPLKGKKKGLIKSQAVIQPKPQVEEEDESNEFVAATNPSPADVAIVQRKSKVKLPTEKQKRDAKKAAEQEEFSRVMAERQLVADRNKQAQERMIAGIQVAFAAEFTPCLDELAIYSCIWGPASERKTLCWGELRDQLSKYGWSFSTGDGSYIIMTPPEWFSHVKVTADAALGINFRSTKFMIHKPHDDALAPMPPYVIAFLREALGSAIGLSDVVVNAMIKKLGEKK